MMRVLLPIFSVLHLFLAAAVGASAHEEPRSDRGPFDAWLAALRAEAIDRGVSTGIVDRALAKVSPLPRVIELDRRQPEFTLTFQEYLDRVVPQSRAEQGRQRLSENRSLLERVGETYGVQPRFIVALWGIETGFGRHTGGFPVIDALVTLAYDGRRSAYFRKELFDALTILDQGHIAPEDMMGSWAGAMGQNQFMPSSFVSFAVDFDGDGRRDIWRNKADIFASTANYLAESGWRGDQSWGVEVRVPDGFDRKLAGEGVRKPLAEWQRLGLRGLRGDDLGPASAEASLVFPEEGGSRAFLVLANYDAILKWNRSTFFAIAVGFLADSIGDG